MNYKIYEIERNKMPDKLKKIKNSPQKLYAIGNIELLYEDGFAIVGTRQISSYGVQNCKYFTKEFALRNINTISGMALGTDSVVHRETIKNGGKTIAVLGCGFNNIFPVENEKLFYEIIDKGGLVLSEYNENTKWNKEYFPKRNRIISAISEGVLVIEAAYRSGTTITARNAKEQGKKVFAVPGIIGSKVGVGVNNLIKKGAILSTNIEDILLNYPQFMNKKRINVSQETFIKSEYKLIYQIIKNNPCNIEEIAKFSRMNMRELLQLITRMELEQIICQESNGKYQAIERN